MLFTVALYWSGVDAMGVVLWVLFLWKLVLLTPAHSWSTKDWSRMCLFECSVWSWKLWYLHTPSDSYAYTSCFPHQVLVPLAVPCWAQTYSNTPPYCNRTSCKEVWLCQQLGPSHTFTSPKCSPQTIYGRKYASSLKHNWRAWMLWSRTVNGSPHASAAEAHWKKKNGRRWWQLTSLAVRNSFFKVELKNVLMSKFTQELLR